MRAQSVDEIQCRFTVDVFSVDEIQDGRFEAVVEVEVEEVRRNKTTLSCAILLELAA